MATPSRHHRRGRRSMPDTPVILTSSATGTTRSYRLGDEIGKGGWGSVFDCCEQASGMIYACKRTPLRGKRDDAAASIELEIDLLELVKRLVDPRGFYSLKLMQLVRQPARRRLPTPELPLEIAPWRCSLNASARSGGKAAKLKSGTYTEPTSTIGRCSA